MAAELNPRGLPAFAAVATTGAGVVDTFENVVTRSIVHAYRHASTGRHPELAEVAATVKAALAETSARQPSLADPTAATPSPPVAPPRAKAPADASPESVLPYGFEHRVDMDAYKEKWAEEGRDRRIMDTETLLSEAVESNMKLAERLDGYARIEEQGERRARMMQALGWLAPLLADAAAPALPEGMLEMLAKACGRSRASFLLFRPSEAVMEERALYGHPVDPLNSVLAAGAGSAAHRASQAASPRLLEDLRSEMFSDGLPPQAEGLEGALVLPLVCDGAAFGSVVVYVAAGEPTLDDAEREFWSTTAVLLSLSLHWRALRQKLAGERRAAR